MKILLSGPPGTGKSHMGEWLQSHLGFAHVDMENWPSHVSKSMWVAGKYREFVEELNSLGDNVALSWGFPPSRLDLVENLSVNGVVAIWLDAPVVFCRRHWQPKTGQPEGDFTFQIEGICTIAKKLAQFYEGRSILVASPDFNHVGEAQISEQINRICNYGNRT